MGESRAPEEWGLRNPLSCCTDWKAVTCTCCMHSALSCKWQAMVRTGATFCCPAGWLGPATRSVSLD